MTGGQCRQADFPGRDEIPEDVQGEENELLENSPSSDIRHGENSLLEQEGVPTYGWRPNAQMIPNQPYWVIRPLMLYYPRKVLSLQQILESTGRYSCFPRYFFEGDRARLASDLATAVLLYGTHGLLAAGWSASDILLNAQGDKKLDVHSNSLTQPFFLVPLTRPLSLTGNPRGIIPREEHQFGVRNSWLYGLGTVLLEILLNAPIESFREKREETKFEISWRVERLAMRHGGPRWAEIISRCLHCPFPGDPDLSEGGFVQLAYQAILEPLLSFSQLPSIESYKAADVPSSSSDPTWYSSPQVPRHMSDLPLNPFHDRHPGMIDD